MKLFGMEKDIPDYTIIVGCGRLGAYLANSLSDKKGKVLVIDRNKEAFRKLSSSFGGMTVIGDAIDFDILHQAQIIKADAVVAVTNNDNINIMVAQIAHELFKVRMVIIRLYDPERECVYSESGIKTICPSLLSANEIFEIFSKKETQEEETDSVEEKE